MGGLYASAIRICGGTAVVVDSHAAFIAGITRLGSFLP
jgi:2-dehydro-3-deoxygalactonokinase